MENGSYTNGAKLLCGRMKTARVDCLYPTCFGKVGESVACIEGQKVKQRCSKETSNSLACTC